MNIYKKIESDIKVIVEDLKRSGTLPETVIADKVEAMPTREASHGDIATNAAMIIAAQLGKNPREIAGLIIKKLLPLEGEDQGGGDQRDIVNAPIPTFPLKGEGVKCDIAGPGFINLTLAPSVWQDAILDILAEGRGYGDSDMGKGQSINIEYVSANPTGPMHVGHGRGAVFGDALATLLIKVGYKVTREYYINDAGVQVIKLAMSVYVRYLEALAVDKTLMDNMISKTVEGVLYPGDYLIPVGEALKQKYGDSLVTKDSSGNLILGMSAETKEIILSFTIEAMMQLIKETLADLGIHFDVFSSERAITEAGEVDTAIALLESKGLIYKGILEPPKGKTPDDWEPREQTLFRSTQFGDDVDRPIKKNGGSWTYFAPDIAYHYDKCKRGFTKLIDVFGVDHGGYVKRLKAVVKALSDDKVELEVKLCQLVKLWENGEPFKMSKRAGTFITINDVLEKLGENGKDVFRFIMLTRKNDMPLDFDFEKVTEQSKDNPVFYVQYAHARARSVIRRVQAELPEAMALLSPSPLAGEGGMGGLSTSAVSGQSPHLNPPPQEGKKMLARLSHPQELALIKLMASWPRMVESAAAALEPHRIAFYLHDLAAAFHGFWNLGNDDITLRFLVKDDIELTAARVALAQALSLVIASGLMVLGVEPLEEMR